MGLTESVAWEVGNYSIRVMTIFPGEVATKMQEDSTHSITNLINIKCLGQGQLQKKLQI